MQHTIVTYGVLTTISHLGISYSLQEDVSGFHTLYCFTEGK